MSELWLSRARLRADAPFLALARALLPEAAGPRAGAFHRLVWQLFPGLAQQQRDFLWTEDVRGTLLVLSRRPPEDPHGLFLLETKPFAPALATGQRIRFRLRANPVISVRARPGERGRRHDVVMNALRALPPEERAGRRFTLLQTQGAAWLERQAKDRGFRVVARADGNPDMLVDGYEQLRIPREGAPDVRISVADFSGHLEVTDPARFREAVAQGFGHARGFGCGLMLIAPARP